MKKRDYIFTLKKSRLTPEVEKHLQRLRDVGVEIQFNDENSWTAYGGIIPLKYEDEGDTYPEDIYEILMDLYEVI